MILQAENLKKIYHTANESITVLNGAELTVTENEIVAIMGPSGSGKSTLLHLLGTLDTPTAGTIQIDGIIVGPETNLSKLRSEKIGFVFQHHYLLPEFTVLENLIIPQSLIGKDDKSSVHRAQELLNHVNLWNRRSHYPNQLSGGEKQRVAVVRALINNPKIVLADEPTGNLDAGNRERLLSLITQLHEKEDQSFIIATHDDRVADIAGRVLFLEDGKLSQK
ncbi:MAG: ABC transporter ATP-binding protein [Candidatus Marinimicrobia bacterium]|nr:ABC transporter ATP-binding protein [Candidatus Neomarinimicrobiota bacterium]